MKKIVVIHGIAMFFAVLVNANAQIAAPIDANSVVGLLPTIMNFIHNGQFLAAGGAIALVICFICNQWLFPKIGVGSAAVPILAAAVGLVSGLGLALANGASPLAAALSIMSGPLAVHAWEAVAQYFVPQAPKA